jgi:hypothetical protein
MIESATNAQHNVRLSANMAAATTHTYSFFVKAAGRINITMNRFNSAVVPSFAHTFTLSGAGTSSGGVITALANDWYRCSGSFTTTGAGVGGFVILLSDGTGTTYLGNGTSGVYIWGAQLEAGSSVTSYIPTTTVAVARNPDIATITGTSFSGFWRVGIGSALASVRPYVASGTRPVVQFDDNTANNIIALRGNVANPELYIRTGGSDQAQIDAGTISANVLYRLAGAWATNDCAASVNSGTPALDGSANIPVVTQARLGSDGTNYLNGHLEAIQYYTTRMLSASLQVVSSTAGYRSIINPVFADTIIS